MLKRPRAQQNLDIALSRAPVVALLGPRQCGKTTLAPAEERNRCRHSTIGRRTIPPHRATAQWSFSSRRRILRFALYAGAFS